MDYLQAFTEEADFCRNMGYYQGGDLIFALLSFWASRCTCMERADARTGRTKTKRTSAYDGCYIIMLYTRRMKFINHT